MLVFKKFFFESDFLSIFNKFERIRDFRFSEILKFWRRWNLKKRRISKEKDQSRSKKN